MNYYGNTNLPINPLLDLDFIDKLHHARMRRTHARIISLNELEEPLENIEGIITAGTVNVDGSSAVRRTCNLTMVCEELNIHEYYWGLKTKVLIWAGLENEIDARYPDIIWFPQGMYVLSSFTTQLGLGNYTVSLLGKDKMVLLNGEMGGILTGLTTNFGEEKVSHKNEATDSYYITEEKLKLKDIITNSVRKFATVPFHRIHVNDLDDMGLELLEYRGSNPMYIIIRKDTELTNNPATQACNMTLTGSTEYYTSRAKTEKIALQDIATYDPLFNLEQVETITTPTIVYDEIGNGFTVAKIKYGMTVGYRLTDLTYAGDLILNVGENVTTLLDKIVQMLGDYEYFFDLNGDFWFLRKLTYLLSTWTNIKTNESKEKYADPNAYSSAVTYSFTDAQLITNYSNNPNLPNVRNDYCIWGTRKGIGGKEVDVHLRFAIDDKPVTYVNYEGKKFTALEIDELERIEAVKELLEASGKTEVISALEQWLSSDTGTYESIYNLIYNRLNYGGLPSTWWDIVDWGNMWLIAMGYIPPSVMAVYSKSVAGQDFDITQYIPNSASYKTSAKRWKLIHLKTDGTVADTYHSTGCSHTYAEWYNAMIHGGKVGASTVLPGEKVYIYDPVLPDEILIIIDTILIADPEEETQKILNEYYRTGLDWRELIYQMALDYNKHLTEDDFHLTIYKNNPDTCPNGVTGYELYYTDMLGFWRLLYDPDYDGSYHSIGLTKAKYLAAVKTWYENMNDITLLFPYYYYAPLYEQCLTSDTFYSTMDYFTRTEIGGVSKYVKVEGLTLLEYEDNPTGYYHISTKEKATENCIIIEPYDHAKYWLKTRDYNPNVYSSTTEVNKGKSIRQDDLVILCDYYTNASGEPSYLNEDTYTGLVNRYKSGKHTDLKWLKIVDLRTVPCYKAAPIRNYYVYYYLNENNEEISVSSSKLDANDYYSNPGKYYHYEDEYILCKTADPFDVKQTYYVKGYGIDDEEVYSKTTIVHEIQYLADPTNYYIAAGARHKVYSYRVVVPDDFTDMYCLGIEERIAQKAMNVDMFVDILRNINYPNSLKCTILATTEAAMTTLLNEIIAAGLRPYAIYLYTVPVIHPIRYNTSINFLEKIYDEYDATTHWAKDVTLFPETINFWFDFLDLNGELLKYSNKAIGNRPKAVKDNTVKSIYFRETPSIIFIDANSPELNGTKLGYSYINLPSTDLSKLFSISTQGKSAKTVLDLWLYKYACCVDSISFTTLPYYNLEPNKRIFVACPESGITGEYIMTKFSVPLGPSGTMTINATMAVDALY